MSAGQRMSERVCAVLHLASVHVRHRACAVSGWDGGDSAVEPLPPETPTPDCGRVREADRYLDNQIAPHGPGLNSSPETHSASAGFRGAATWAADSTGRADLVSVAGSPKMEHAIFYRQHIRSEAAYVDAETPR